MITGYELYKTFPFGYNMKIIRSGGEQNWVVKTHPYSNHPDDSKIRWFWTEKSASKYAHGLTNPSPPEKPHKIVLYKKP